MLIILEGPDLAGKTTLAERLASQLHAELWHRGVPQRHVLEEYVLDLQDYRPGEGRHIVCDRWHWGDLVYGPLKRGKASLDLAMRRYVDLFLQSRGAVVVYLNPGWTELERRWQQRHEDYVTPAELREIATVGYPEVVRQTTLPYTRSTGVRTIATFAELYEAGVTTPWRTYVGPPRPSVLLFGEKRGGNQPHRFEPCFVPYPATSGHFLLGALPGELEGRVGIANACEDEEAESIWTSLRQPPVVALGRAAARELDRLGVPHGTVPHPQYVRRFHHRLQADYGDLIEWAARTREDAGCWPNE